MKKKIVTTILLAAIAVSGAAIYRSDHPKAQQQTATKEARPLHIELVATDPEDAEFTPGGTIAASVSVKNAGEESAWTFIEVTVPTAKGAVLTDGTKDPPVLSFTPDDGWSLIESDSGDPNKTVYAYAVPLASGETTSPLFTEWSIPEYDLHSEDGRVMSGMISAEEIGKLMNSIRFQGKAVMSEGIGGTPEQRWEMLK